MPRVSNRAWLWCWAWLEAAAWFGWPDTRWSFMDDRGGSAALRWDGGIAWIVALALRGDDLTADGSSGLSSTFREISPGRRRSRRQPGRPSFSRCGATPVTPRVAGWTGRTLLTVPTGATRRVDQHDLARSPGHYGPYTVTAATENSTPASGVVLRLRSETALIVADGAVVSGRCSLAGGDWRRVARSRAAWVCAQHRFP